MLEGATSAGSSCSSAWPSCPASATLLVLPPETAAVARAAEDVGLPELIRPEVVLMAQNWRYSSRKARRELGYRARPLDRTLTDTIEWYRELIDSGRLGAGGPLPVAGRRGRAPGRARRAARGLQAAEDVGRELVAP